MHTSLAVSVLLLSSALATPAPKIGIRPPSAPTLHMPLKQHKTRQFSDNLSDRQEWLKSQAAGMRKKYSHLLTPEARELQKREEHERLRKRDSGSVQLTDSGIDASYSGQVSIGTPAQNFLLIFDTGSSDMWVAGQNCQNSDCAQVDLFNANSSSTFKSSPQSFDITYGSGEAAGETGSDKVAVAGFTVNSQTFGIVDQTTADVINYPISGILGFGWKAIAQTQATPLWQQLASSGQWSDAEMGFFLERYRGDPSASSVESNGGQLTMGGTDTSKYTGSINYVSFPSSNEDYWRIPMQAITVQGSTVSGVSDRESALDTGTTLISATPSDVQAIYAQIPNSQPMDASTGYQGYYQYPCSTNVNVTLQFGGLAYEMSNADFNLGQFTRNSDMCTGAFFEMDLGQSSPVSWIVGASFLKNVYSVFRYNSPAIGFAALSGNAQSVSNGTSASGGATNSGGTQGGSGSSGSGSSGGSSGSGTSSGGSGSGNGGAAQGAVAGFGMVALATVGSIMAGLL